jgi:type III secretory pathway lipoprotein EscJ
LKSEGSFLSFLKGGGVKKILPLLAVGVALLVLSSPLFFGREEGETVSVSAEGELSELCSAIDGVGRCRVMITYGEGEEVAAVAVLCDGADSVEVRARLNELISSLYGIRTNRISVVKMR